MSLSRQLDTAFDQVPYPTPRSTAASNLTQPFLPAVENPQRVGSGRPRQFARNGCCQRILPVSAHPGEGHLTEQIVFSNGSRGGGSM